MIRFGEDENSVLGAIPESWESFLPNRKRVVPNMPPSLQIVSRTLSFILSLWIQVTRM